MTTWRDAALGSVSVVMMPSAPAPSGRPQVGQAAGRPASMRSTGSVSMITPVENGSTCRRRRPAAASAAGARARARPSAPGAGVGVAGVDHQRADRGARRQVLAAHLHRRGAEAVLGEHAGHGRQLEHRHIATVGLAHTCHRGADLDTSDQMQILRIRSDEVHGHHGSFQRSIGGLAGPAPSSSSRRGSGFAGPPGAPP
jgi:hypothetical protein